MRYHIFLPKLQEYVTFCLKRVPNIWQDGHKWLPTKDFEAKLNIEILQCVLKDEHGNGLDVSSGREEDWRQLEVDEDSVEAGRHLHTEGN